MTREQFEQQLIADGYSQVAFHEDPPDFEYPEHDHPVDTSYIVARGMMIVSIDGKEQAVREGERIDIKKHVIHSAKIGNDGCAFLIGVRI